MDGRPETYRTWAADYYEQAVELAAVEHVYRHQPLTTEVVKQLNPDLSLNELATEIRDLGYPA